MRTSCPKTYLSKTLPLVLHLNRLVSPLLSNDLRNLGIGKSRVLGNDLALVVLTIKDESYKEVCVSMPEANSCQ